MVQLNTFKKIYPTTRKIGKLFLKLLCPRFIPINLAIYLNYLTNVNTCLNTKLAGMMWKR
jgi:hypothetical protein